MAEDAKRDDELVGQMCEIHMKTGFCVFGSLCNKNHPEGVKFDMKYLPIHLSTMSEQINHLIKLNHEKDKLIQKLQDESLTVLTFVESLNKSLELYGLTVLPTGAVERDKKAIKGVDAIQKVKRLSERCAKTSNEEVD